MLSRLEGNEEAGGHPLVKKHGMAHGSIGLPEGFWAVIYISRINPSLN